MSERLREATEPKEESTEAEQESGMDDQERQWELMSESRRRQRALTPKEVDQVIRDVRDRVERLRERVRDCGFDDRRALQNCADGYTPDEMERALARTHLYDTWRMERFEELVKEFRLDEVEGGSAELEEGVRKLTWDEHGLRWGFA
jgi:hypothetical protein